MDELMSWAKENYDLITLLIGVIGIIIAFIFLIYELNERKRRKIVSKLKLKQILK